MAAGNLRQIAISIKMGVQRKCSGNRGEGEINSNLGILKDFVKDLGLEDGSLIMVKTTVSLKVKKRVF